MTSAPQRRLADRLLDAGIEVARTYADQDRLDPKRPTLGTLVAETLANHERIGEERVLGRVRAMIEERTALRDERLAIASEHIAAGLLPKATSEVGWAAALDDQIDTLRLLLTDPTETPS